MDSWERWVLENIGKKIYSKMELGYKIVMATEPFFIRWCENIFFFFLSFGEGLCGLGTTFN